MEVGKEREVQFYKYCKDCVYFKESSDKEPCNECLHNATNAGSRKPVNFKQKS